VLWKRGYKFLYRQKKFKFSAGFLIQHKTCLGFSFWSKRNNPIVFMTSWFSKHPTWSPPYQSNSSYSYIFNWAALGSFSRSSLNSFHYFGLISVLWFFWQDGSFDTRHLETLSFDLLAVILSSKTASLIPIRIDHR